jgi:hypothetical protein
MLQPRWELSPFEQGLTLMSDDVQVKAERIVLEANGKQGLLTCSLRLSGIFGFVPLSPASCTGSDDSQ